MDWAVGLKIVFGTNNDSDFEPQLSGSRADFLAMV